MKNISIWILILLIFSNMFAQDTWKLKGGMNFSWFESADKTKSGVGYIVELQRSLGLYGSADLLVGLNLQSRSVVLEDRTVSYLLSETRREIALTEIHASVAFIEIPVVIGYTISLSYFSLFPYAGGSLSFNLADNTSLDRKRVIYPPEEIPDSFSPDFIEAIKSVFGNNGTDLVINLGLELQLQRYLLDLRYIIDLRDGVWVDRIDKLNYKTRGWSILLGYRL